MPFNNYFFILFATLLTGRTGHRGADQEKVSPFTGIPNINLQKANHAPVVRIVQPSGQSSYSWNEPVPYSVQISDNEDGESKYQEIQSTEVLVKLQFVANTERAKICLKQKKMTDTAGIAGVMLSNCFNCHAVKTKRTGPSFQDISRKYPLTEKNIDILLNRIRTGSTGFWGNEVMPSHTELSEQEIRRMVIWLLRYSNNPNLNFYSGLEGILALTKPGNQIRSGLFVMTAMYTDHGTTDEPDKKLSGSDQVLIRMK